MVYFGPLGVKKRIILEPYWKFYRTLPSCTEVQIKWNPALDCRSQSLKVFTVFQCGSWVQRIFSAVGLKLKIQQKWLIFFDSFAELHSGLLTGVLCLLVSFTNLLEPQHCFWKCDLVNFFYASITEMWSLESLTLWPPLTFTRPCLQTSPSSWPTTPSTTLGRGTQSTSAATSCPTRLPQCSGRGSASPSRPRPPQTPGCTRPRASQCSRWVQSSPRDPVACSCYSIPYRCSAFLLAFAGLHALPESCCL